MTSGRRPLHADRRPAVPHSLTTLLDCCTSGEADGLNASHREGFVFCPTPHCGRLATGRVRDQFRQRLRLSGTRQRRVPSHVHPLRPASTLRVGLGPQSLLRGSSPGGRPSPRQPHSRHRARSARSAASLRRGRKHRLQSRQGGRVCPRVVEGPEGERCHDQSSDTAQPSNEAGSIDRHFPWSATRRSDLS